MSAARCYGSLLSRASLNFMTMGEKARKESQLVMRVRSATTSPSGAILPEPKRTRFGFVAVISSVIAGVLIGATISKMMANFLEENDLFVPSDDDDDDD